ncbi:MAG: general secretion pathway protein GspB [Gammaproteobacteria bacterium]|nr:general secretion pathway protein GspB [Gammaproteobacteria bacterium]
MSFVLDALKLSEKRRSRFARPVYAHPPPAHRGGRRVRWIAVLAAAPIIAGVFLTWRLVAPPSPAPLPAAADAADMSAAFEPGATLPDPARDSVADPEEPGDLGSASPGTDPSAPAGEEQPASEVPIPVAAGEPTHAAQPPLPAEGLPLEMAPPDWPSLTLQMLFFGPESGRSFVQINGRNYRVGERLDDGPEVLEIAPDGVILAYQGKKVLLAMDR